MQQPKLNIGFAVWVWVWAFAAAVCITLPSASAADDGQGLCNITKCERGNCTLKSGGSLLKQLVPECVCQPGWKKLLPISFMPCVIPNCTIDYSCGGNSSSSSSSAAASPAPPPAASLANFSIINVCNTSAKLCGKGDCVVISAIRYKCACWPGYYNLLNISSGPCVQSCAIDAACKDMGIPVSTPPISISQNSTSGHDNTVASPSEITIATATASCLALLLLFL